MTLKERIKSLADAEGISLPVLESKLGFGNSTIVKWDKSTPNAEKLNKGNVVEKYDTAEKIGNEVDKKYDKTGGTISGNVVVTGNEVVNGSVSCNSFILNGYTVTIEE